MLHNIQVTTFDMNRLFAMIEQLRKNGFRETANLEKLEEELARSDEVAPSEVTADVVTMNSRVRFCFDGSEQEVTMTLTYPKDMNGDPEQLSILTPVGTALLGLKVGDSISWERPDGALFELSVRGIEYQPERDGQYHR